MRDPREPEGRIVMRRALIGGTVAVLLLFGGVYGRRRSEPERDRPAGCGVR